MYFFINCVQNEQHIHKSKINIGEVKLSCWSTCRSKILVEQVTILLKLMKKISTQQFIQRE